MPDQIPLDIIHLFIFTIPGFFIVWSFRNIKSSKHISDYEYFMFSTLWGVLLLAIIAVVEPKDIFVKLLSNIYASAVVFSIIGMIVGSISGFIYKKLTN